MASPTSCTPSLSCSSLRRQSSEIRAVCASERSYGSARGATSDGRPYRDHVIPDEQPVRFRSQVGVLTTAYRRGPEVRFGEVTWTCSRLRAEVPAGVNSRDTGLGEITPEKRATGVCQTGCKGTGEER